jgi:hypothetical protein
MMLFAAGYAVAVFFFALETKFNQPVAEAPMWFICGNGLFIVFCGLEILTR